MPAELLRISAITFIVRWEQETMFFLRRQVFFLELQKLMDELNKGLVFYLKIK